MPSTSKEKTRDLRAITGRELAEALWQDRSESYYSVHPTIHRKPPTSRSQAFAAIEAGDKFFAPMPRIGIGNSKEHCANSFNVLWADLDRDTDSAVEDLLAEVREKLPNFFPSVAVFSGNRGLHLYWMLDHDISSDLIEQYNRHLMLILNADNCFDRTHFFRLPGTTNEKSNRQVSVVSWNLKRFGANDVKSLDLPKSDPGRSLIARSVSHSSERSEAAQKLSGWMAPKDLNLTCLTERQRHYLIFGPQTKKTDRSRVEAGIVYRLTGRAAGASDAQVIEFADNYFAKHREQRRRCGNAYIQRTIDSARDKHFENGWITSEQGGWPRKRNATRRAASVEDLENALDCVAGQPMSEWVSEIMALGWSRTCAYRWKDSLASEGLVRLAGGRIHRSHEFSVRLSTQA